MKIFSRYLLMRILVPFTFTLFACTMIWVMTDLYGNIDDFLGHKINFRLLLYFYALQVPIMLVQVLPAVILFSSLWTLLSLSRTNEWLAFQAGGIAPTKLFVPFFLFAIVWAVILAYDLNGPSAWAQVTRERLLQEVKGQSGNHHDLLNVSYVDNVKRQIWFFQRLDTYRGVAHGVEILQRDAQGHDVSKYFARDATWTGNAWKLTGILEFIYVDDGSVETQKSYTEKDIDLSMSPSEIGLVAAQPDQLTLAQLDRYIQTSTSTPEHLAGYRTEWWYRVLHPVSLIVLLLYALVHGTPTGRRGAVAGVGWTICVLLLYVMVMNVFMAAGRFNRLPPWAAVMATQVIFGLIGLQLLAVHHHWYWRLQQLWSRSSGPRATL